MSANEYVWETFDGLFKAVHRQTRRVEELEARVAELERRLNEQSQQATPLPPQPATNLPAERAA